MLVCKSLSTIRGMNGDSLSMIIRYLYQIWISKFNEICYLWSQRTKIRWSEECHCSASLKSLQNLCLSFSEYWQCCQSTSFHKSISIMLSTNITILIIHDMEGPKHLESTSFCTQQWQPSSLQTTCLASEKQCQPKTQWSTLGFRIWHSQPE